MSFLTFGPLKMISPKRRSFLRIATNAGKKNIPKTMTSKSYTRNLDPGSGSALNQCGSATLVHMVREKPYYVKLFSKLLPLLLL
jgi:hypothetical protein